MQQKCIIIIVIYLIIAINKTKLLIIKNQLVLVIKREQQVIYTSIYTCIYIYHLEIPAGIYYIIIAIVISDIVAQENTIVKSQLQTIVRLWLQLNKLKKKKRKKKLQRKKNLIRTRGIAYKNNTIVLLFLLRSYQSY